MSDCAHTLQANILKKRRLLKIALLPILAPIFLIGFALTHFGEPKSEIRNVPRSKTKPSKEEETMEIGLLSEAKEEEMVVAKRTAH